MPIGAGLLRPASDGAVQAVFTIPGRSDQGRGLCGHDRARRRSAGADRRQISGRPRQLTRCLRADRPRVETSSCSHALKAGTHLRKCSRQVRRKIAARAASRFEYRNRNPNCSAFAGTAFCPDNSSASAISPSASPQRKGRRRQERGPMQCAAERSRELRIRHRMRCRRVDCSGR